jgi:hypothetical protein
MDTILYFYRKKNSKNNQHEENGQLLCEEGRYDFADYTVIHLSLSGTAAGLLGMADDEEKSDDMPWYLSVPLLRRNHIKKKEKLKKYLLQQIAAYWNMDYGTYWVCRESVCLPDSLRFNDYRDEVWIDRMLVQAKLSDYIVIGTGIDIGIGKSLAGILLRRARRMRSLTIYLTQKDYAAWADDMEELETLLYEEYGLAARLTVTENSRYRWISLEGMPAANILDMTAEETFVCSKVPEGSRWFDMACSSEKKRKVENCLKNVSYYSVNEMFINPKKWKTDI